MENDLVHQFSPGHESVWFQTFANLLSMSKSSSFSIALSQFAILIGPSYLSASLVCLIPSVATSAGMFGLFAGIPDSFSNVLPFAVSLCPRLIPFVYMYRPLYKEAEMRGTFFAPLVIWHLALGPVLLVVMCFAWKVPPTQLRIHLFAAIGPFVLLSFFREGADHFQNAVAVTSAVFPFVVIVFTELLRKFAGWPRDDEWRGIAKFIVAAIVVSLFFGGYVCASRTVTDPMDYFDEHDIETAAWVSEGVPADAVVVTKSKVLHPLVLTGRQQFLADRRLLWRYGMKIAHKLDEVNRLLYQDSVDAWKELGVHFVVEELGFVISVRSRTINESTKYALARVTE
jgi:hypothetical protein